MRLNWWTFILEIINFLVLVWILKRAFYMPIKKAIEKRKSTIQQELAEADNMRKEAEKLHNKYEVRLTEWAQEKEQKKVMLAQEFDEERAKQLIKIKQTLKKEEEKFKAHEKNYLQDLTHKAEQQAVTRAAKFSTALLTQFASSELETKIIRLFLQQIESIPEGKLALIKDQLSKLEQKFVEIQSAFAVDKKQKQDIISKLKKVFGSKIAIKFLQNKSLLAGLDVSIGSIILHANLRDELKFFSETPFHE